MKKCKKCKEVKKHHAKGMCRACYNKDNKNKQFDKKVGIAQLKLGSVKR